MLAIRKVARPRGYNLLRAAVLASLPLTATKNCNCYKSKQTRKEFSVIFG